MLRLLAAALLLSGLAAAPAGAATFGVRTTDICDRLGCGSYAAVEFVAAPGEANRLTLTAAGTEVLAHDDGAAVAPGAGCRAVDAATVACPKAPTTDVGTGDGNDEVSTLLPLSTVRLGTGDDRFTGTANVTGGDGADTLTAGAAGVVFDGGADADTLVGSPGRDTLEGGPGADDVQAGAGDDTIRMDEPAPFADDRADGGPGRDELVYQSRTVPVVVDLADPAPDGSAGERDVAVAVEDVTGGQAADRLVGDAGPNSLFGASGRDVLEGGAGDDELRAGAGATLRGGAGDDALTGDGTVARLDGGAGADSIVLEGSAAPVACGSGRDTVTPEIPDRTLSLRGCERVLLDPSERDPLVLGLPTRPGGPFRLTCPDAESCRVVVRVSDARGRLRATARLEVERGRTGQVTPRARGSRVRVTVTFGGDADSRPAPIRARFVL